MPPGGEASARELMERWLREDSELPKAGRFGGPGFGCPFRLPSEVQEELPVFWDLPTGGQDKASGGKDPLQWANLARPDGWLRVACRMIGSPDEQEPSLHDSSDSLGQPWSAQVSHYMAVGCISARDALLRFYPSSCETSVNQPGRAASGDLGTGRRLAELQRCRTPALVA